MTDPEESTYKAVQDAYQYYMVELLHFETFEEANRFFPGPTRLDIMKEWGRIIWRSIPKIRFRRR